jgi:hypothetical protein
MRNGHAGTVGFQVDRFRNPWFTFQLAVLLAIALIPLIFLSGCAGIASSTGKQAVQALFQLNPGALNFGKVSVGKQTTQAVSVSNSGKVAVNITQATLSNSQFSLVGASLPMALAVGQSGTFTVAVDPTAAGNVTGTLTVAGDGNSSPVVANLSATGVGGAQPQLSVTPASINFGTVSTGLKPTANLVLNNLGSADLTVSMMTVTGSAFAVSGITTPKTISAGQSAQATVTFSPTTAGAASGSISIVSNDPANPTLSVPLTGTGTSAPTGQLTASSTNLSFGSVAVGAISTQQVAITNTGNAAVQISKIGLSGAEFTFAGMTAPATLNPSETGTLSVNFAPTAAGNLTGSIVITSNASGSPMTITLSGTGAQAGLSVTPASFNFGGIVEGQTKSQSFTVKNTGTAWVTIAQIAANGAGFSVSGLSTPATLAAGQSATFSVLFAPTAAGSLPGSVLITSNTPSSPNAVPLSGTGTAASVTLSANPISVSFSGITVGSSGSKGVTITNSGNTNLTISQVSVNAKDFSATGITTPLTLNAGQNAALNVSFKPSASEQISGNITVTSSQGASAVIPVSGGGVQTALTVTPSSVSFGRVSVGSPNSQTIQLTNSGTGVLTISQVSATGAGYSTSALNLPLSLSPNQSTTFNVQFAPASSGSVNGSVSIVSNAPNSPAVIGLSGSGVASTQVLSFSTHNLGFGSVDTGMSATQSVTVTNTGNANVTISRVASVGTGFSLSGAGTPVTLTPTQSLTFSVTFSPASAGNATGTVTVTSNASGSPATIALSGTGSQTSLHAVALSWNASTSSVSGYNVYRSTTSGSGYLKINSSLVGAMAYTDSNVQSATTYYYVTTAVDSSGNESVYSNQATAVIP